jgi:HK97 family phage portal protein
MTTFLQRLMGAGVFDERHWSADAYYSTPTASGESVAYSSALKLSAYYACVSLIADTVAVLPKHIMERRPDGSRARATDHPLYDIVHQQPNRTQTSIEFFALMTACLVMRNNAYARILPGPRGFADQIVPIMPDKVRIERLEDGRIRYMIREGTSALETPYNDEDILHIRNFQLDIAQGVDMLPLVRESVGVSLATQKYRARFFGNSAQPGGVLKKAGKMTLQGHRNLKESWQAAHAMGGQHTVAILEDGLEWQSIGIDPRAAQMIESEEHNAEDICRWMRVPPFMIGLTAKSTSWGTGIEQQNIGFVTYTILPYTVRWQQAISRDLILAPDKYYVEFVLDGLLRGDSASRYNVYRIGRELGMYTPNDLLRFENQNPRTDPGGDEYVPDMGRSLTTQQTTPEAASPPTARYRHLLSAQAERIVRKEMQALEREYHKLKAHSDWAAVVQSFYLDHASFVSELLGVTHAQAVHYCEAQRQTVATNGPEPGAWRTAVERLVTLAEAT